MLNLLQDRLRIIKLNQIKFNQIEFDLLNWIKKMRFNSLMGD